MTTPEELADEMQMPVERVRAVLRMAQQPISLQSPVGDSDDANLRGFYRGQGRRQSARHDQPSFYSRTNWATPVQPERA